MVDRRAYLRSLSAAVEEWAASTVPKPGTVQQRPSLLVSPIPPQPLVPLSPASAVGTRIDRTAPAQRQLRGLLLALRTGRDTMLKAMGMAMTMTIFPVRRLQLVAIKATSPLDRRSERCPYQCRHRTWYRPCRSMALLLAVVGCISYRTSPLMVA